MITFYEIRDNVYYRDRWYLGDIHNINDNWIFIQGKIVSKEICQQIIQVEFKEHGHPMNFSMTEGYSVPIISQRLYDKLKNYTEIQFIPIVISHSEEYCRFYILVAQYKLDCVDESTSELEKFKVNDAIRPDLAGSYKWINKLVINPMLTNDLNCFRLEKALSYLIVSEQVKKEIEEADAECAVFTKVTL